VLIDTFNMDLVGYSLKRTIMQVNLRTVRTYSKHDRDDIQNS
jgi:hypothetical protein